MLTQRALDLILESEGLDQPGLWPGGDSGITLGVGYDLGYTPAAEFTRDWRPHLTAGQITRLSAAIGAKAQRARALAGQFRDIRITRDAALEVFNRATAPKWEAQTRAAFPGCELLPADAFGALVSLTFNRGPGMDGERRREMRSVRQRLLNFTALTAPDRLRDQRGLLAGIAADIRAMKRLWQGQGLDGLLRRREAEARLVESAA